MKRKLRVTGFDDSRVVKQYYRLLAGMIDANGLIFIGTSKGKNYYPILRFRSYVEGTCENLVAMTGVGSVSIVNANRPRYTNFWLWSVTSKQASCLLEKILPYLVDRKKQAELCIELQEINDKRKTEGLIGKGGYKSWKGRTKLPPNLRGREIYDEIKILNKELRKKRWK